MLNIAIPMRRIFFFFLVFSAFLVCDAQIFFSEDFSDGDITGSPAWFGDISKFRINADTQLQLNDDPVTGKAVIYSNVALADSADWYFYFRLDFNPSNSNYLTVFLSGNGIPGTAQFEGFYLKVGESGNADALELYHVRMGQRELIIRGTDSLLADPFEAWVHVAVKNGKWALEIDTAGKGSYLFQGSKSGFPLVPASYFGIECTHSASRNDKFYFDDFRIGPLYEDLVAPFITSLKSLNDSLLQLRFSEDVDSSSASAITNYSIIGKGQPLIRKIQRDSQSLRIWNLELRPGLINREYYQLQAWSIRDLNGNSMDTQSINFLHFIPAYHDIVINELFPDPSPPRQLPEAEFVEIYNASGLPLSLNDFALADAAGSTRFANLSIDAGEYLILCDVTDTALFSKYGRVYGMPGFPSLNNSGDDLSLYSAGGELLDRVSYKLSWYQDESKKEGGWTLERIEVDPLCEGKSNWHASTDQRGGTPGISNSVAGTKWDYSAPLLLSARILNPYALKMTWDEPLSRVPDLSMPSGGPGIDSIERGVQMERGFLILHFSDSLQKGILYSISLDSVTDCSGNYDSITLRFLDAFPLDNNDLVINEILFNPRSGGVDYVEILNRSRKIIPVAGLEIGERDPSTMIFADKAAATQKFMFLMPQDIYVFTSDTYRVASQYFVRYPDKLLMIEGMPNFPDEEGVVLLRDSSGKTIDSVHYFESWHYDLLADRNGVSLERIDPAGPSNDPVNWFSASSLRGYGTPTDSNSQLYAVPSFQGSIDVNPEVFSPDLDGYKDLLILRIQTEIPGYTCRIRIFDSRGYPVRTICDNELLSAESEFRWDGLDDERLKLREGIYIIDFELLHPDGILIHEKRKCVLTYRK